MIPFYNSRGEGYRFHYYLLSILHYLLSILHYLLSIILAASAALLERLNEKDATAFSAVFNHFHMKINVSPIQVLCFSFFFELIIAQTTLDYKCFV